MYAINLYDMKNNMLGHWENVDEWECKPFPFSLPSFGHTSSGYRDRSKAERLSSAKSAIDHVMSIYDGIAVLAELIDDNSRAVVCRVSA